MLILVKLVFCVIHHHHATTLYPHRLFRWCEKQGQQQHPVVLIL